MPALGTRVETRCFVAHGLLSCKEHSIISPEVLEGPHAAQPLLPFPSPQDRGLLRPCSGNMIQLAVGTGAGQERLEHCSSIPVLARMEQTLAVLSLAGATAYFWKLWRLPRRSCLFFPFIHRRVSLIC